ncbi:MAG TPA: pyruvate, water dikinase regulatory protein [Ignavibacteriaceae bacterium]|nr:pyruvate, water dikinase regulatory protein [Ignavibacteriaceae bacterium]
MKKEYNIYIVSDGTGRTAEQALNAALAQFGNVKVNLFRRPKVRTEQKVINVIKEAKENDGFIVHTLVTDKLREAMLRNGRKYNVDTIDLMGGLLGRLSEEFSVSPAEKPGLFGQLNKTYFRRIETMEFAFHHDDGQRVNELKKAEIVLLGVSRTFKTPLSIYLAFKGWFVANVPIIMGQEFPPIINKLLASNIFCLDTNARALAEFRRARQSYLGGAVGDYDDIEYVRMELMYARNIFSKNPGWAIINVTNKPIEEIASEILTLKGERGKGDKFPG